MYAVISNETENYLLRIQTMEYLCLKQSMSERTVKRNGRMRQKLLAMALPIKPMTFTKYYIYMNMKSGWFDEYVKWFVISINNISIFFFLLHRLFLDSFVDCWFPSNSSSSGFFLRCDCINCIRFVSWHSTYFARVFFCHSFLNWRPLSCIQSLCAALRYDRNPLFKQLHAQLLML